MTDLYYKILCRYESAYERPYEALMENAQLLWIQREKDVIWDSYMAEMANRGDE